MLLQRHGFGAVLVTRAQDGMSLITPNEIRHYPGEAAKCSTCPAPAIRWWQPWPPRWPWMCRCSMPPAWANIAGGIVVGKVGTAVARQNDILAAITLSPGL